MRNTAEQVCKHKQSCFEWSLATWGGMISGPAVSLPWAWTRPWNFSWWRSEAALFAGVRRSETRSTGVYNIKFAVKMVEWIEEKWLTACLNIHFNAKVNVTALTASQYSSRFAESRQTSLCYQYAPPPSVGFHALSPHLWPSFWATLLLSWEEATQQTLHIFIQESHIGSRNLF